ncbi:restriction endonuclease subunit S [Tenacibaculum aquimarinum]|uniref:restriction endonuclease subunit S n=1 Tax=Tenacibaculum aquimarinum TaxID=2910675 RepID=UPI001F0AD700|nr:restriction endonuclease subunit S [Tenacibaculum aquimarinum]MCH3885665.1 restriction endonuclease subunit S [Tenacibaculum aquimarinum]
MKEGFKETELGSIPSDWSIVKFDEVAELRHGYQFRNYDFTESGIKILKITQIKGNETVDLSSCSFINENRLDEFERVIINKGDILVALTGATIGKIARFNSEEIVLQNYRVGNFFPLNSTSLSKDYFFQFLRSSFFYNQILARQTQSAQQNIGKEDINNMSMFFPPIKEQKAIANLLTAFDDKIENLRAQNQTLEQTAQTIFKEWFGKYQIGDELPEGWRVEELDNLLELIIDYRGKTPKKLGMEWSEKGIPALSAKTIKNGKIVRRDAMNFGSPELYKIWMKDELQKGDILLTSEAPLGEMYYINDDTKFILSQRLFALRVNEKITSEYLYDYLFSKYGQHQLNARASGSTVQGIRQSELRKIEVIVPEENIMKKASLIFRSSIEKKAINSKQIQTLTKTRDALLPKLMRGEIRVSGFKK